MGRDDARAVAGLQGGAAPARTFADFMKVAVAKRPAEQFETQAPMPDWQLEPDEEAWGTNTVDSEPLVDADGNRSAASPPIHLPPQPQDETQQWLDEVLRRNPENRPPPTDRPSRPNGLSPPGGRRLARRQSGRPTRFSRGPSDLSSGAGNCDVPAVKLRFERPEFGPVIHVPPMGNLMRNQPAQQVRRSQDDPPAVSDRTAGRTASPTTAGVSDRNRADRYARFQSQFACYLAQPIAGLSAKISFYSRGKGLGRPAAPKPVIDQAGFARKSCIPVKSDAPSLERYGGSGKKGFGRLDPRQLPIDPRALAGSPCHGAFLLARTGKLRIRRCARSSRRRRMDRARGWGRSSTGQARPGRLSVSERLVDKVPFQIAGIDFADRPAASRLARLVNGFTTAADQIMPFEQGFAFPTQPIGAGCGSHSSSSSLCGSSLTQSSTSVLRCL
jgi:hypothetical protein